MVNHSSSAFLQGPEPGSLHAAAKPPQAAAITCSRLFAEAPLPAPGQAGILPRPQPTLQVTQGEVP